MKQVCFGANPIVICRESLLLLTAGHTHVFGFFRPFIRAAASMDELFLSPFAAHSIDDDDLFAGLDADDIDELL